VSESKYCVVGLGYVGLPCAVMLANAGCKVLGYDISKEVVDRVTAGAVYAEPELQALLLSPNALQNLHASVEISGADVFIIAVPTPLDHRKKTADLDALVRAVRSVASVLKKGDLVIVESTVPPLTMRKIVAPILEQTGLTVGDDVLLAHCPERLLPGNIIYEIIHNNRVIGGINQMSAERAAEVYRLFVKGEISLTDDVTAELCKLMENTYRDVNIALANELSEVCKDIGVDVDEAINLANLHPRVNLLKPGIGVGGHCLPIDPWFIHEVSPYNSTVIEAARHINDDRPAKIAAEIRRVVADDLTQGILLLGKTYKAGTNDTRESPAIRIYELLKRDGYNVMAYDSEVDRVDSLEELIRQCSCLFVLVPHPRMMLELDAVVGRLREEDQRVPRFFRF